MSARHGAGLNIGTATLHRRSIFCCILLLIATSVYGFTQQPGYLDPARNPDTLIPAPINGLTEQFIWTAGDAAALDPSLQSKVRGQDDKIAPHYFRAHFNVGSVPAQATLYLAGPRSATVTLNGSKVLQFSDADAAGKGLNVMASEVAGSLRSGENVIAIEEIRGHSSLHTGAGPVINQVTYGEVLAVKIVPRGIAEDGTPLLVTNDTWRSTLQPAPNWTMQYFDDSAWPLVQSLGVLGGRSDFLQWNADASLYAWPGYSGISPAMRTFRVPPVSQSVNLATSTVMFDFGKEIAGRIHLVSSADRPVTISVSYGESAEEAQAHPYLGVRSVTVPRHGEAYGPKSGFRYVRLTFPAGTSSSSEQVDVQGISFPVEYKGSFESSDPTLNRIWETGAYTAHLCMQEGIWDGVKRDRGRWMGDLDVTGRVISSVFADRGVMEPTMDALIGDSPVERDVNTIAGYSALWITGQANFYRHSGDLDYLRTQHQKLVELLAVMNAELDSGGLFTNPAKHKVFVDWSTGFNADTPEARAATQFEFYLSYQEAAYLLTELGDIAQAAAAHATADKIQNAAQDHLLSHPANTFGTRWQTNSMAVLAGAATPDQQQAIWTNVLSLVTTPGGPDAVVTPYYGYYVLSAMARLNHRAEALNWMRQYWGGMLAEGATSFWEAYDPRWPKQDFHAHLEADGKTGYYVSLAHGWSGGPTAWLMEQVLGIEPTGAGFRTVNIRPDLAGLVWARGTEPTPRGLIRVSIQPDVIQIDLPLMTRATISLPFLPKDGSILINSKPVETISSENGTRSTIVLNNPGQYTFTLNRGRH